MPLPWCIFKWVNAFSLKIIFKKEKLRHQILFHPFLETIYREIHLAHWVFDLQFQLTSRAIVTVEVMSRSWLPIYLFSSRKLPFSSSTFKQCTSCPSFNTYIKANKCELRESWQHSLKHCLPTWFLGRESVDKAQVVELLSREGNPHVPTIFKVFYAWWCFWWCFSGGATGKQFACQCRTPKTWVWSLGGEDPLEEGTATHSSIHAWRTPWAEEPGRRQSTGSQRVGQDWTD